MRKKILSVLMIAGALSLAACGGETNTADDVKAPASEASVSLDKEDKAKESEQKEPVNEKEKEEAVSDAAKKVPENSVEIGGYFWSYNDKAGSPLTFEVYDKSGEFVEKLIVPILGEAEYYGTDEPYDWQKDYRQVYLEEYQKLEGDCVSNDICDEIYKLTGVSTSENNKKLVNMMFNFMQNKTAYVPGNFEAFGYADADFKFALTDLDKNGENEVFISGGGAQTIYVPKDSFSDSNVFAQIKAINPDKGIVLSERGDLGGYTIWYQFDGTAKVLEKYSWEVEIVDGKNTERMLYTKEEVDGSKTAVTEEEFKSVNYGEVPVEDAGIGFMNLDPATFLNAIYTK